MKEVVETDRGRGRQPTICEVVLMHINEDVLDAEGRIDQRKIDWDLHGRQLVLPAHGDALRSGQAIGRLGMAGSMACRRTCAAAPCSPATTWAAWATPNNCPTRRG